MTSLLNPSRDLTVMPFWFWNDDLDEEEIIRQIDDFEKHGVYGFVIHPRVGLPRELAWMSEALLHFYRIAINEAKQRRLRVSLYDEGMYPSGSSSGQVVAENPAYACRCLAKIDLPDDQPPSLKAGENLVAIVKRQGGEFIAVIDRPVKSHIRGLHYIGEGPAEDRPAAADLLNPNAVAAFIRLVYDKFAEHFGDDFGKTIVSIFTDEPALLGKCEERDVYPGTTGIFRHVNQILGYDFTNHLPALWYDDEPDAQQHRQDYLSAIKMRLQKTYYSPLSKWCKQHQLALTGHPQQPDDIDILRYFQVPGQDTVWRKVLPDDPSALEGAESTQAKCSASVMLHTGRRRNANECFGAYGQELTWEEMLWLSQWLFVRGVNLLYPHAFYYSVRGVRRDERPPDVGPHSAWWTRYSEYALACRRFAWLNTDSSPVCSIAVLGKADFLPWRAAKVCFQNQRDFNYLTERDILELAVVDASGIHIANVNYLVLILEYDPGAAMMDILASLAQSGRLIRYQHEMPDLELVRQLDTLVPRDIKVSPSTPALRVRHVAKENSHYYLLFNEEKDSVSAAVNTAVAGERFLFNPYSGATTFFAEKDALELSGHEAVIMIVREKSPFAIPFNRQADWLLPLATSDNKTLLVFSACDSRYLGYAVSLIRSLDVFSPGFQFLLHIVNPDEIDIARLKQLPSLLTATRLSVSFEYTDLSSLTSEQQRTYYACVRFLRLAELLPVIDVPVLCLDADSLIVNPIDLNFSDKAHAQLCLIRRDTQGQVSESLSVANGSIWLTPTAGVSNLVANVAQEIGKAFANRSAAWYLDQVAMGRQIKSPEHRKIAIFNIKRKYADWDFHETSIVWAGKGSRKHENLRYFLLQRLLGDDPEHQRRAVRLYQDVLTAGYKGCDKIFAILSKVMAAVLPRKPLNEIAVNSVPTDIARWSQNARQKPTWDDRVKLIAAMILPGSSVLDIGAGAMTLASYLAPGSEYTPLDVIPSSDRTELIDFNTYQIPELTKVYDVAVCSGVMEYVLPVDFFMFTVAAWANTIILSYAITDLNSDVARRQKNGWLNHLSEQELRDVIARHGLIVKDRFQWQQQVIYVLDSRRANCSFYYAPGSEMPNHDIASVFRYDTTNVGDFYCPPFRYFDMGSYRSVDIMNLQDVATLPQNLIIGGGGLLGSPTFKPYFEKIFSRSYKSVIGWGMGENSRVDRKTAYVERMDLVYPDYINRFDLLGVRDYGTEYTWVPCASCYIRYFTSSGRFSTRSLFLNISAYLFR